MSEQNEWWWKLPPDPKDLETLDMFAAHAMAAIMHHDDEADFENTASGAYEYAIAMMKERLGYK